MERELAESEVQEGVTSESADDAGRRKAERFLRLAEAKVVPMGPPAVPKPPTPVVEVPVAFAEKKKKKRGGSKEREERRKQERKERKEKERERKKREGQEFKGLGRPPPAGTTMGEVQLRGAQEDDQLSDVVFLGVGDHSAHGSGE